MAFLNIIFKNVRYSETQILYNSTIRELSRQVKLIFDKHHIDIPYPQVVIHQPGDNSAEKNENEEQ